MHVGPDQFGQNRVKENVVGVLQRIAQNTMLRTRAVTFSNLIGRRQVALDSLPHEDLNLGRDARPSDLSELSCTRIVHKFRIQGLNREAARGDMWPNHSILCLRERGEEGSKTLPLTQLFRRQGLSKSPVPIMCRQVSDGNLRVRTKGEQGRESRGEGGIPTPPVQPEPRRHVVAHLKLNVFFEKGTKPYEIFPEVRSPLGEANIGFEEGKYLALRIEYQRELWPGDMIFHHHLIRRHLFITTIFVGNMPRGNDK